jgi:diguanylate cyclase (GGDEF)-like protein
LNNVRGRTDIDRTMGRITDAIRAPVPVGDLTVRVGASVGVACFPGHGDGYSELLRYADADMYRMKRLRREAASTA